MKEYITLRTFDNYMEARIVLNMLQHDNISCHLKDENTITIDPLLSPALGGIKLMVHQYHVQRARQLIENAEKAYLRTVACPICKAHTLKIIFVTRKYRYRWMAVLSRLLNGRPVEKLKMYRCTSCGSNFRDLPA